MSSIVSTLALPCGGADAIILCSSGGGGGGSDRGLAEGEGWWEGCSSVLGTAPHDTAPPHRASHSSLHRARPPRATLGPAPHPRPAELVHHQHLNLQQHHHKQQQPSPGAKPTSPPQPANSLGPPRSPPQRGESRFFPINLTVHTP